MRLTPSLLLLLLAACGDATVKLEGGDTGADNGGDNGGDTADTSDTADTGEDTAQSGSIQVGPASLDFGLVFVGQSGTAEITLTNTGTGAVDVTIGLGGDQAGDYAVSLTTAAPPPRTSETVTVTVTPSDWGTRGAVLVFDDAVSGGHLEVPLTTVAQVDADGDAHGSAESGGDDCDDTDATVFPGAPETWYDGVDQDCAGDDDYDQDGDTVPVDLDCDDTDPDAYPGAPETWYDGIDQDCAGGDDYDQDGDGVQVDADCDDTDPSVYPGAKDPWYDGIDQDCRGNDDYDRDGDGWVRDEDCDDGDPLRNPGATENWYDGVDQDCAGDDDYDQDADGIQVDDDCDDTDPGVGAASEETLDGLDNDCDGRVDDVPVTDVLGGVVYGSTRSLGLGDKGAMAMDADVTGDGIADLVALADYGNGYAWAVSGPDLIGASDAIGDVDVVTVSGASSYYPLAASASPAGDLDGDGTDELIVTGWSGYGYGYTWVFEGGTTGSIDTGDAWASFGGDSQTDQLMSTVVGDLDGDGAPDLVTGAPLDNSGSGSDVGNVSVFTGDLAGSNTIGGGAQIEGDDAYDYLGYRMALADVTGDGYDDLLVGAPGDDDGGDSAGAVYLFAGEASLAWSGNADDLATFKLYGTGEDDAIGEDPIPVPGDVDGDGRLDVLIGSEDEGEAWLVLGSALPSGAAALGSVGYSFSGSPGDFATALSIDTDLDGDGADEVIIGGDGMDDAGANAGVVWVYRWDSGWSSSLGAEHASVTLMGTSTEAYFGTGLAGGSDLDGDGREDLAVGAAADDTRGSDAGAVYLVMGW